MARLADGWASAGRQVLVIDQMEELFTSCRDSAARVAFVDAVLDEVDRPGGTTLVVAALRADFYGHCASIPRLAEALTDTTVLLGPMSETELRQAIEGPAEVTGYRLDQGLVDLMLRDLAHEPGSLPLLSHALLETWHRRTARTMTIVGYEESGGVRGAIARTAESVWNERLSDDQREARAADLPSADRARRGNRGHPPAGAPFGAGLGAGQRRDRGPRRGPGRRSARHDRRGHGRGGARGADPRVAAAAGLARRRSGSAPHPPAPHPRRGGLVGAGEGPLRAVPRASPGGRQGVAGRRAQPSGGRVPGRQSQRPRMPSVGPPRRRLPPGNGPTGGCGCCSSGRRWLWSRPSPPAWSPWANGTAPTTRPIGRRRRRSRPRSTASSRRSPSSRTETACSPGCWRSRPSGSGPARPLGLHCCGRSPTSLASAPPCTGGGPATSA